MALPLQTLGEPGYTPLWPAAAVAIPPSTFFDRNRPLPSKLIVRTTRLTSNHAKRPVSGLVGGCWAVSSGVGKEAGDPSHDPVPMGRGSGLCGGLRKPVLRLKEIIGDEMNRKPDKSKGPKNVKKHPPKKKGVLQTLKDRKAMLDNL